jgi:hypothetical protein
VVSSGACDKFSRNNYRLTSCCKPLQRDLLARLACSRVRVTRQARLGATSPLPLSNFNGQPVSPSPFGQRHALITLSQEGDDDTDLYPATQSTLNKGSAILVAMLTIFGTDEPQPK